jgi:hypothetical protein
MRFYTLLTMLLPAVTALGCSGRDSSPTEVKPEFAGGGCTTPPTITAVPTSITQPPQSSVVAAFKVANGCASTSGPWDMSATRSGAVISVGSPNPSLLTLGVGRTWNVSVPYNTGAIGPGTVLLRATMDGTPIKTSSGTQTITVAQAGGGIPFGIWDLNLAPGSVTPGPWTGGVKNSNSFTDIMNQLKWADTLHLKVWFGMAGGYGGYTTYVTHADGKVDTLFDLAKWKSKLNAHAGHYSDYLPYITKGTMQGIVLLDDLAQWNPDVSFAEVEEMARYSKSLFPALQTAVRERATILEGKAPLNSCNPTCPNGANHASYTQLDAAWAQFRSPDRGTPQEYRDSNIEAAKREKLGLILGINITNGNRFQDPDGVTRGHNVTDTQLLSWGQEFLKPGAAYSDYICGFFMWDVTYPTLESATMNSLAGQAAGHVAAPCRRR